MSDLHGAPTRDAGSGLHLASSFRGLSVGDLLVAAGCLVLLNSLFHNWLDWAINGFGLVYPVPRGAFDGIGIIVVLALPATVAVLVLRATFLRSAAAARLPAWVNGGVPYLVIAAVELATLLIYFFEFHVQWVHAFYGGWGMFRLSPAGGFFLAIIGALLTGAGGIAVSWRVHRIAQIAAGTAVAMPSTRDS